MKKYIALMLSLVLILSAIPSMAEEPVEYASREYVISSFVQSVGRANLPKKAGALDSFTDADRIKEEFKSDFERAVSNSLITGYEDNTLRPDEYITRIEALVILSRSVPKGENCGEVKVFADMKPWAKEDIDKLSSMGIVNGYGNGLLGADDYITKQQVKLLTDRADEILNTSKPGEDFYNYVNNKTLRNVTLGEDGFDENFWSNTLNVNKAIENEKAELLKELMDGTLGYEKGTAAQRVHDMLECIHAGQTVHEEEKALILSYRKKITDAKTVKELADALIDIYSESGIELVFDIGAYTDAEDSVTYPYFDLVSHGHGGLLTFEATDKTSEYVQIYESLLQEYFKECSIEFEDNDIKKAVEIQQVMSDNENYLYDYIYGLELKRMFKSDYSYEEYITDTNALLQKHANWITDTGELVNTYVQMPVYIASEAENKISVSPLEYIEKCGYGKHNCIKMPDEESLGLYNGLLKEENLNALKINALIDMAVVLQFHLTEGEMSVFTKLDYFELGAICKMPPDDILIGLANTRELDELLEEVLGNTDYSILSNENMLVLESLLPKDMGILWSEYNYDETITEDIKAMTDDILNAYRKRINENLFISETSKKNANDILDDMYIIIGYSTDYPFPEIVPMDEGGNYVSNLLNIIKSNREKDIRTCNEPDFVKRMLFDSPDTVNAVYYPRWNVANVPAAFLEYPIYDKNASYATNLGSVGAVIAHEIGHAFLRSENAGVQWLTEEDKVYYDMLEKKFAEYFANYEAQNGQVQDSYLTAMENMADYSGIMIGLDILGDNPVMQKEFLESYAKFWAMAGSDEYIQSVLGDVHSTNSVRVNANVASFDCFYEIYDIQEDDDMYVEKEKRLKLW